MCMTPRSCFVGHFRRSVPRTEAIVSWKGQPSAAGPEHCARCQRPRVRFAQLRVITMYIRNPQLYAGGTSERLPAFSVATALSWLGHDNCHTCPEQVHARANVWLIRPPVGGRPSGMRALVDVEFVDPPWSRAEDNGILAEINVCTCRDRIQVELRSDAERIAIRAMGQGLRPIAER